MARLFLAVVPSVEQREALLALATPIAGARWRREEQLHVTLHFLGEIEEARAAGIARALGRVDFESFDLAFAGVGVFPSARAPRVLWAAPLAPEPLVALHAACGAVLAACDVSLERRRFRPHATLARLAGTVDRAAVADWLERHARFRSASARIGEFELVASELLPAGSRYRTVARYPGR